MKGKTIKFVRKIFEHLKRRYQFYLLLLTICVFFFAPMWFMLVVCLAWLVFFTLYPLTSKKE